MNIEPITKGPCDRCKVNVDTRVLLRLWFGVITEQYVAGKETPPIEPLVKVAFVCPHCAVELRGGIEAWIENW